MFYNLKSKLMKTLKMSVTLCVLLCFGFTSFSQKVVLMISTREKPTHARGMLIEYRKISENDWKAVRTSAGYTLPVLSEYTFDYLQEGVEYSFRVRLISDYGIGAPCQAVTVEVPREDKAYVYMRNCPEPPQASKRYITQNSTQMTPDQKHNPSLQMNKKSHILYDPKK